MMVELDWQTDVEMDGVWQEQHETPYHKKRVVRWTAVLFMLTLVGFGALRLYGEWQTQRAENAITQLLTAQNEGLFGAWLGIVPAGQTVTSIEFVDGLLAAEATTHHTYTFNNTPFTLAQQHVLTFNDGWQTMPIEWGERIYYYTIQERFGAAVFDHDLPQANQIIRDMGVAIYQYCLLYPDLVCPPRGRIPVNFTLDFDDLSDSGSLSIRDTIYVPSPGLLGRAIDHASYQQLRLAYAHHIMRPVIAEMSRQQCCPDQTISHPEITEQLTQLGVLSTQ